MNYVKKIETHYISVKRLLLVSSEDLEKKKNLLDNLQNRIKEILYVRLIDNFLLFIKKEINSAVEICP